MSGRCLVLFAVLVLAAGTAAASPHIRCENVSNAELVVDGLLDDWGRQVATRVGVASDGAVELRCSWDGSSLALALDIKDDRVVRVRGKGHEDRVELSVRAGGKPATATVWPGNAIAKPRRIASARVRVADSLQPKGFSVEALVPGAAIPGLSAATPSLELSIVFHDSDQATGGDTIPLAIGVTVELSDRKDLLEDFLRTVKLRRTDVTFDTLAELDPDRKGKERVVAGGTVIGVLTDQFAYVTLPAQRPADVRRVELVPLGARGHQVVAATVRQSANGGSRDLLMLWTVRNGQLEPLVQVEIRKEVPGGILETTRRIVAARTGPELWVEPTPAVGVTPDTWHEEPASDADPIVLPWDTARGGIAYTWRGLTISRRDLPRPRKR